MGKTTGKNNRKTYEYGLIGEKLGHSFSPLLHERFGKYGYGLTEIAKDEVDAYLKKAPFKGINVTIPYKEKAMRYCEPDDNAKAIGCVNTLVKSDGKVKGYNTDTFGFEYMIKRANIDVSGKKVLILGSGGTCRTAAYTVSRLKAASVTIVSRQPSDMGMELLCPLNVTDYDNMPEDFEVLVNTTPLGMYPGIEKIPIDISNNYVNLRSVIDVVYNPLCTRLVYNAKKRGLTATGGLSMLVAQGYFASKLFSGKTLGQDPVGSLTEKETKKLEEVIGDITAMTGNIVITGMPGSGKTTVGRIVAEKLGLEFVDTDEMFEADNGISPAKCIRRDGESVFRALEKKTVYKASQKGGRVIATGGGVVLDPENIEMLSLNGTIVYLHRKLAELATANRPLSEGTENLKALYYTRLPIYLASCDLKVVADKDAKAAAKDLLNSLHNKDKRQVRILVINGPNLNMLGIREPDIYGHETYKDLMRMCREKADELSVSVSFFQSNHEGELVDIIQRSYGVTDGIVINPGAYTHTSVALLDALKTVGIPAVEVHISDVGTREDFRQRSYIRRVVSDTITGHGLAGYTEAMEMLVRQFIR